MASFGVGVRGMVVKFWLFFEFGWFVFGSAVILFCLF